MKASRNWHASNREVNPSATVVASARRVGFTGEGTIRMKLLSREDRIAMLVDMTSQEAVELSRALMDAVYALQPRGAT